MIKYTMDKRAVILQFLLLNLNIFIGKSDDIEVSISVRYVRVNPNTFESVIYTDKYKSFLDAFFGTNTSLISLRYKWDRGKNNSYIYLIQKNNVGRLNDNLHFLCTNNKTIKTIMCHKDFPCQTPSKVCNGFAVYGAVGEYIHSRHLKSSSFVCANGYKLTCYTLIKPDDLNVADISTTEAPHIKVDSDSIVSSLDPIRDTAGFTDHSITSMQMLSTQPAHSFISSTLLSVDQKPNSSSSVSTSVIVGVTVSGIIVIVIVILIVIIFIRKKQKKESKSNNETSAIRLDINFNTFSGNIFNHLPSSNGNNNSKSSVCILTNNEQPKNNSNSNRLTSMSDKGEKVDTTSDSEYSSIKEDRSVTLPDRLLSSDKKDNDGYYNTLDNNRKQLALRPITRESNFSTNRSKSDVSELQIDPPTVEYATVNKNVGYKSVKEILRNKHLAAVHEYNNITDENTTIGKTEPAKNVYSKLRENIRHFENTYGDLGVSMEVGEDNATQADDNTYFTSKAKENSNRQKLDLNK